MPTEAGTTNLTIAGIYTIGAATCFLSAGAFYLYRLHRNHSDNESLAELSRNVDKIKQTLNLARFYNQLESAAQSHYTKDGSKDIEQIDRDIAENQKYLNSRAKSLIK